MISATETSSPKQSARPRVVTPAFQPPGPGTWELDADHFPKPAFGFIEDVFPEAFSTGMGRSCERYGMLLAGFDVRFVHGFPFMQPKIVGVPAGGGKPPPRAVMYLAFKLLCALHPEVRRRMRRAAGVFVDKPWRETLAVWDGHLKRATLEAHRAMDAIDPEALSDDALAAHVERCVEHAIRMLTQDHSMNLDCMLPVSDFLVHATAWTGWSEAELMPLLRGHSAISAGEFAERRALLDALRDDDGARALLDSKAPAQEVWARLTSWPGAVGEAMRDFRLISGNAICHGLDLTTPTVNDEPGPTLAALRASLQSPPRAADDGATTLQRARDRVPTEHQATFDELLDDARETYRLRDERHLYGALPTLGLGRRILKAAARRLRARGAIDDERLVFVARCHELTALLRGEPGVDLASLAERVRLTETLQGRDVPHILGPEPPPPPPLHWMPNDGARRCVAAIDVYMKSIQGDVRAGGMDGATTQKLEGMAVSGGVHEGTARLCLTADDLTRVQAGDVLVAPLTTPAINVVLPILGAIVTDRGGALSHAAIVSREFGIPGVVGTRRATQTIVDGARVRVDGGRGVVEVLT